MSSRELTWASQTVVTPTERKDSWARSNRRRRSSGVMGRWKFGPWFRILTPPSPVSRSHAESKKSPVGSPASPRSMRPPLGVGVEAEMPRLRITAEFTT